MKTLPPPYLIRLQIGFPLPVLRVGHIPRQSIVRIHKLARGRGRGRKREGEGEREGRRGGREGRREGGREGQREGRREGGRERGRRGEGEKGEVRGGE